MEKKLVILTDSKREHGTPCWPHRDATGPIRGTGSEDRAFIVVLVGRNVGGRFRISRFE